MAVNFPIRTITSAHLFNKSAVLGAVAPTDTVYGSALAVAHGIVGRHGKIEFAVGAGATITAYIYMKIAQKWLLAQPAVVAAANTIYNLDAPEGAPFFLVANAGTPTAWYYDEKYIGDNNA